MSLSSKSMEPTVLANGSDWQKENIAVRGSAGTWRCSYYVSASGLSKLLRIASSGCPLTGWAGAAEHIDPRRLRRYVGREVRIFDQACRLTGRPQVPEEFCRARGVAFVH